MQAALSFRLQYIPEAYQRFFALFLMIILYTNRAPILSCIPQVNKLYPSPDQDRSRSLLLSSHKKYHPVLRRLPVPGHMPAHNQFYNPV